jgi:4-diphosphocytidyl-2-C-methyl-D-erythritol kinase
MITLKAPAKINWSLYVLDRREDGYHNILSLMQRVGLYDTLILRPSSSIELFSDLPVPAEKNLVFRSARALQEAAGVVKGAAISLEKEIPTGAGLGGGSSDAAFTLVGLNRLWELGLDTARLREIGAKLGSDVPFFIDSCAALVTGRGEILSPARISPGLTLLIVKPGESISTAAAYQAVADERKARNSCSDLTNQEEKLNNIKLIIGALNDGSFSLLGSLLRNDFERVAIEICPVISDIKERLVGAGAAAALLSGSGSAVFGLFESRADAVKASALFSLYWNRVAATL